MGLFSRKGTHRLLLVKDGRVKRVPTSLHGMELVQEISRLLRSEHITSTRVGEEATVWHVAGPGTPNAAASRLLAEHGLPPVSGVTVVAGALIGASIFPLDPDAADRLALKLEQ